MRIPEDPTPSRGNTADGSHCPLSARAESSAGRIPLFCVGKGSRILCPSRLEPSRRPAKPLLPFFSYPQISTTPSPPGRLHSLRRRSPCLVARSRTLSLSPLRPAALSRLLRGPLARSSTVFLPLGSSRDTSLLLATGHAHCSLPSRRQEGLSWKGCSSPKSHALGPGPVSHCSCRNCCPATGEQDRRPQLRCMPANTTPERREVYGGPVSRW
jgi:hypothetical protein